MGKVGPKPQTNDHRSLRTNMVGSEDKTTNLTDPKGTQTCVILVTPLLSEMTLTSITVSTNNTHVRSIMHVRLHALLPIVSHDIMCGLQ